MPLHYCMRRRKNNNLPHTVCDLVSTVLLLFYGFCDINALEIRVIALHYNGCQTRIWGKIVVSFGVAIDCAKICFIKYCVTLGFKASKL